MGLHDRAWSGLGLMIYGSTPLLPMKLEQALANASPGNELRLESFERYEDAYEHSKRAKNVGFIFLSENCGKLPPLDVFAQLAKPYANKGWPCFGVLVHEGEETFLGFRTLQREPGLLAYISAKDLLNPDLVPQMMDEIWNKYVNAFEASILPPALQDTYISVASDSLPMDSIQFRDRVSTVLSSTLNVSWVESVALRWVHVAEAVKTSDPKVLEPNTIVSQICELAVTKDFFGSLDEVMASKASLCVRIANVALHLDRARLDGSLARILQDLATRSKPGAPALIRHLTGSKEKILEVAHSIAQEGLSLAREAAAK